MALRTLVVDDSGIYRRILSEAISRIDKLELVEALPDAPSALQFIQTHKVDLITLDISMPRMDGLEFLRQFQEIKNRLSQVPTVAVVSGVAPSSAEMSIEALSLGALEIIPKPMAGDAESNRATLAAELTRVATAVEQGLTSPNPRQFAETLPSTTDLPTTSSRVDAICIGASTGGPRALASLLPKLRSQTDLPIVILNHIPVGFDQGLASSLGRNVSTPVQLAEQGHALAPNLTLIAPAGIHIRLVDRGGLHVQLREGQPENGCCPAVDVLYNSLLACPNHRFCCVILTGMGSDGARHLPALVRRGHLVLAQDKDSSTVYGMPRAAAATKAVHKIVALDHMAQAIVTGCGEMQAR